MKSIKANSIVKGIAIIVLGIIIAFLPDVINKLFYIIGIGVIIYTIVKSIIDIINTPSNKNKIIAQGIIWLIIGILFIYLPHIIGTAIPVIGGMIIATIGVERCFEAYNQFKGGFNNWYIKGIFGAALVLVALFLIFKHHEASNALRVIIGIILMIIGGLNIFSDLKFGGNSGNGGVIDVDKFEER